MSMLKQKPIVYDDGRTKQSFKDETDINKILKRAQKTGTISHLAKHQGSYADFSDFDFLETQLTLVRGREIFDELPSELRAEFNQSPGQFFEFANDPENSDRLAELLPLLAAPGRQDHKLRPPTADEAAADAAKNKPAAKPETAPEAPTKPPEADSTGTT